MQQNPNIKIVDIKQSASGGSFAASLWFISVWYEGQVVGDYYADLWIADRLIIEIKAVQSLLREHEVKLVHYLTATRVDNGLLINFGPSVQVKRKFREYKPRATL